jgi:CRISPR-associated endonuclease Cas1
MKNPSILSLRLEFESTKVIDSLPFYHCVAWNGFFRNVFKPGLREFVRTTKTGPSLDMKTAGIRTVPIENGARYFLSGDGINVDIYFDLQVQDQVMIGKLLSLLPSGNGNKRNDDPENDTDRQHFSPASVKLRRITCKKCGQAWDSLHACTVTRQDIEHDMKTLENRPVKVIFHSPLIRKTNLTDRPYVDPVYLLSRSGQEHGGEIASVIWGDIPPSRPDSGATASTVFPAICRRPGALWIKTEYARKDSALYMSFNGVVGTIELAPSVDEEFLYRLALGRLTGLGNSTAMGFGSYEIELPDATSPTLSTLPSSRLTPLNSRTPDLEEVRKMALDIPDLPFTVECERSADIQAAPDYWYASFLGTLRTAVSEPRKHGFHSIRAGEKIRKIHITNPKDHLRQKAIGFMLARILDPPAHTIFRDSVYSYRKGRGHGLGIDGAHKAMSEGREYGLTMDIASFFESIDRDTLFSMLQGLFWRDPLLGVLADLFEFYREKKIPGLPQGSPLSPILSNVYLLPLDNEMERIRKGQGIDRPAYFRYSDDMLFMSRTRERLGEFRESAISICSSLGLDMNPEKSREISAIQGFTFLGSFLQQGRNPRKIEKPPEPWKMFSSRSYLSGLVLYLTGKIRRLTATRDTLTLEFKPGAAPDGEKAPVTYHWKEIARIVVIAGAPGSTMIVEQALRREIPLAFIDYRGTLAGMFLPERVLDSTLPSRQCAAFSNARIRLDIAKQLVMAKLKASIFNLEEWKLCKKVPSAPWDMLICDIRKAIRSISGCADLDSLRGMEGAAARAYFSGMKEICSPFVFTSREYHPPKGEVNAVLSFGYTLLYSRIASTVKAHGLLPHVGVFHEAHGTHMVLVSDLMEPFRFMVDRLVMELIHSELMNSLCFDVDVGNGFARMKWDFRNTLIRTFEHAFCEDTIEFDGFGKREISWCLEEDIKRLISSIRLGTSFSCMMPSCSTDHENTGKESTARKSISENQIDR